MFTIVGHFSQLISGQLHACPATLNRLVEKE